MWTQKSGSFQKVSIANLYIHFVVAGYGFQESKTKAKITTTIKVGEEIFIGNHFCGRF